MAWNGTNFLVVWQDHRSGTIDDIYGARVSAAGSVLDPAGIPISTAANDQLAPAVAWNGTDFLVVWEDCRSGTNYDIYGDPGERRRQRARPRGHLHLHRGEPPVAPAVAWNGTDFLVVWTDCRAHPTSTGPG